MLVIAEGIFKYFETSLETFFQPFIQYMNCT